MGSAVVMYVEAATGPGTIDWFIVFSGLFGGLALFLMGMDRMTRALRVLAGDRMRGVLRRLTSNRVVAATAGAALTAVIQSSSVTSVLVVGLITAGLLTLVQAVGVLMGANVGTTITAQIIAFDVPGTRWRSSPRGNEGAARRVGAMKSETNSLARKVDRHEAKRLVAEEPNRIETYAFETDLIANLKRVFYFTRRTARVAIPAAERAEG